jgi:hypothetical protein
MTYHPLTLLAEIRKTAPREMRPALDRLEYAIVCERNCRVDPRRVRALHAQRLTDAVIAARLHVSDGTILYWRRRLGLAAWR